MSRDNMLEHWSTEAPEWVVRILPIFCAAASGIVLIVTGIFYSDKWNTTGLHWFDWIQAALLALACIMSLVAAALLAMRKPAGWDVLLTALCVIPAIMAFRLAIAVLTIAGTLVARVFDNAGHLIDVSVLDRINLNPVNIAIVIVVLAVILFSLPGSAGKPGKTPGEKK